MNPYIADILFQPQAIRDTLAPLQSPPDALIEITARLRAGAYSRVILTAMGGSLAAQHVLWNRLARAGIPALIVDTSELLYGARGLIRPDALLVVVSQSGRSAEVVRLLDLTQGATTLAITNTVDSPLAQRATCAMLTRAGEESTVSCKTYVSAVAALSLIGEALAGGEWLAAWRDLAGAAGLVDFYVSQLDQIASLIAELVRTPSLVLCGRGSSAAAALCGALIIKEAAKVHAEGMGSAAFRHGPLELATTGLSVFVFEGTGEGSALNARLTADVNRAGGDAHLIGRSSDDAVLRLPDVPPAALPVLEILPAQMLSVGLARRDGREPGKFLVSGKVTLTE